MAFTTPAQRITDLESEVFQGTHQVGRLTADVTALKEQGKLHAELLSEALQDLRDLRIDLAGFKTEVRDRFDAVDKRFDTVDERFTKVDATLARQGAQLDALMAHFGVQLPATQHAASN
ncbi:hypothetical protein [Catelliglobosispora koreensis]|uniref:hypothetical protein n=1 Tax=Catelliglobosispora koreensis TaxID=129052 RepID=UPI0012FC4A7C|nr:hypothetical protein [Catelliglobosispora koreensis]